MGDGLRPLTNSLEVHIERSADPGRQVMMVVRHVEGDAHDLPKKQLLTLWRGPIAADPGVALIHSWIDSKLGRHDGRWAMATQFVVIRQLDEHVVIEWVALAVERARKLEIVDALNPGGVAHQVHGPTKRVDTLHPTEKRSAGVGTGTAFLCGV
jgi:hypothetical protein